MKLGSLFDGIGGFPLSAIQHGIDPVWASEIEPFPIVVTKKHFPNMKHLGDITKINGAEIEPVEIITGGSPCQDLSVAGKRAGLAGERSGLLMEQVRIVKEMREHDRATGRSTESIRPRFMVWENVPGAFSSNGGEDFRAVLEETARIADETVTIPRPRNDKWDSAGAIMGRNFSLAWRVIDAQYWGVPQRRRRIFLVADFGGQSAPEILFKRQGLSRHIAKGREAGQRIATDAERGVDETGECLTPWDVQSRRIHKASGKWPALYGGEGGGHGYVAIPVRPVAIENHPADSRVKLDESGTVQTLTARMDTGGGNVPMLAVPDKACSIQGSMIGRADKNGPQGDGINEDVSFTLNTTDRHAVAFACNQRDEVRDMKDKSGALQAQPGMKQQTFVATKVYGICSYASNSMKSDNPHSGIYEADTSRTLDLNGGSPACNQGGMAIVQKLYESHPNDSRVTGPVDIAPTISQRYGTGGNNTPLVQNIDCTPNVYREGSFGDYVEGEFGTLKASGGVLAGGSETFVSQSYTVRRLTPTECERLQGFPDDWTNIPGTKKVSKEELEFWRGVWYEWDKMQSEKPEEVSPRTDKAILRWLKNPTSDTARYKSLGNSVAVPCVTWIMGQIAKKLKEEKR